jgi:hypothetical protein
MNQIAERHSTDVALQNKNAFEAYADAATQNRIVGDLLKFSKGEYLSGQDGKEVEEGTELVANMDEFMIGWVRWEGGKPTDMRMGRIDEGFVPPARRELGDTDENEWEIDETSKEPRDPWQMTNYLIMKDPSGEQLFTFATSSKGGIGAVAKMAGAYGKAMRQRPDEFPIVALNVDSYRHPNKAYGKIFTPKLDIVGWVKKSVFDGVLEAAAEEAEAERKAAAELDEKKEGSTRGKASGAATRF